ncbi:MAG: hypothetical protein ACI845_000164 [Gammaproteobacteria bacterium]
MAEKYFLTPQTANLMEDLYREIGSRSSLFLLYGVKGIGKSSFVHQFLRSREFSGAVVSLDFTPDKYCKSAEGGGNTIPDAKAINHTFENCQNTDLIIIDHLEEAGQKARHQIFQSWMTDGIDKRLNVLLITASNCLSDFSLLSNQYKASIQSFQLLPFNKLEIDSYIGLRTLPQSAGIDFKLELSSQARKALKKLEGKPVDLDLFCENYRDQIKAQALKPLSKSWKITSIFIIILTVALASLASWFLIGQSGQKIYHHLSEFSLPQPWVDSATSKEDEKKQNIAIPVKAAIETNEVSVSQNDQAINIEIEGQSVSVEAKQSEAVINQSKYPVVKSNLVVDPEPEVNGKLSSENMPFIEGTKTSAWFKQQLINSMDWITSSNHSNATIQMMSIGFDRFDDKAYQAYFQDLVDNGVVQSEIRVFQTYANETSIFSVIYGQYENRKAANRAIAELPQSLKANQPIPRTIGGIWREIQQYKK